MDVVKHGQTACAGKQRIDQEIEDQITEQNN